MTNCAGEPGHAMTRRRSYRSGSKRGSNTLAWRLRPLVVTEVLAVCSACASSQVAIQQLTVQRPESATVVDSVSRQPIGRADVVVETWQVSKPLGRPDKRKHVFRTKVSDEEGRFVIPVAKEWFWVHSGYVRPLPGLCPGPPSSIGASASSRRGTKLPSLTPGQPVKVRGTMFSRGHTKHAQRDRRGHHRGCTRRWCTGRPRIPFPDQPLFVLDWGRKGLQAFVGGGKRFFRTVCC